MKIKLIALVILFFSLSACHNFLDVIPETSLTSDSFYQSQADFEQAVGGIYAPLQGLYNQDWILNEMRSDNTFFIYNIAQRGGKPQEDPATFTVENNNTYTLGKWTNDYLIISRANQVLKTIDAASFDQAVKTNLKGQALFLRAFAYFDLVKNFGGVPLFVDAATSYKETFKSRAEASEVYKQIIADATAAAKALPAQASAAGRATSGAAYTLLADAYMNQKSWADAETALKTVTTLGYTLLPAYADIFKPTNKGNKEIIFDVQYAEGTSQAIFNALPYLFIPVLADPSVITGVKPATQQTYGGYNVPTPDLLKVYEDTLKDQRFSASIGFYTGPSPLIGITYNRTPYIKKYLHPHAVYGQTADNGPIYRYAEVLLMLAEVANEQGRQADAAGYLNQVRARAGLTPLTAGSQADVRTSILKERQIELVFENKRWHDLVRSGLAVQVMTAKAAKIKANPQAYYYPAGSAPISTAFNITDRDLLYPIPVSEIITNPDLKQNPGY
ncbi:RagB/SusD family nutrient uptake outer membrane protein [Spirosoma sp. HMF4905]|uniref:RagB/SusD family nutrient uptake outer membrane protein n=1 Tax=Spirosoma arboris TaxID=2682092 RepID=A0A7K1SGS8_9BACT|nr:RagB/SusD family nutrient uptake outer membrane protein [Spirosoma arboris]MVM33020.1 RagB/SusD family nutrient uptake outer membrane protein [Spirosoma arboris]